MYLQTFRLSIVRFSILNFPIEKTWKLKEAQEEQTKQNHKSFMFPSSELSRHRNYYERAKPWIFNVQLIIIQFLIFNLFLPRNPNLFSLLKIAIPT